MRCASVRMNAQGSAPKKDKINMSVRTEERRTEMGMHDMIHYIQHNNICIINRARVRAQQSTHAIRGITMQNYVLSLS